MWVHFLCASNRRTNVPRSRAARVTKKDSNKAQRPSAACMQDLIIPVNYESDSVTAFFTLLFHKTISKNSYRWNSMLHQILSACLEKRGSQQKNLETPHDLLSCLLFVSTRICSSCFCFPETMTKHLASLTSYVNL